MTSGKNTLRLDGRVRRAVLAGALALTLSAGGATAWALDRFVFEHVEISDVPAYEASQGVTPGTVDTARAVTETTDTSYTSADSSISISTVVTGSGESTVTAPTRSPPAATA